MKDGHEFISLIKEASQALTSDGTFLLAVIVYDEKAFGNKLVLLTSNINLNIIYTEDRGFMQCELRWAKPSEMLPDLTRKEPAYFESILDIKKGLGLSRDQMELLRSSGEWVDIEDLFAIIGLETISKTSTFLEWMSSTSKLIRQNLEAIVISLDDTHRADTIAQINEKNKQRVRELFGEEWIC